MFAGLCSSAHREKLENLKIPIYIKNSLTFLHSYNTPLKPAENSHSFCKKINVRVFCPSPFPYIPKPPLFASTRPIRIFLHYPHTRFLTLLTRSARSFPPYSYAATPSRLVQNHKPHFRTFWTPPLDFHLLMCYNKISQGDIRPVNNPTKQANLPNTCWITKRSKSYGL